MPQCALRRRITGWRLNGHTVALAEPPLRELVGLLLADHPLAIILGTARHADDADWVAARILDHDANLTDDLLHAIADGIATAYFGRSRWQAAAVWERGIDVWSDFDGELVSRGVDVMLLPPDRATNAVWRFITQQVRHDKDARDELYETLTRVPPEVEMRQMRHEVDDDASAVDWAAAAQLAAAAQG